ncbi:hypothetical protein M3Y97_00381500 [Aphelenchoides bicaudatus]|nr:hypothetical protein M3Y97_00381500 [Aphelenchoides bicaudatus]
MRYMRSRNIQLETLVNELHKEIQSYQSASKSPLQSEPASFDLISDLPCAVEEKSPSDLPTNPLPEPSFLPDEEQSKPQFETCTPAERSLFNLTRSFFHKMATMANSTALTLFMEGRPELTKLTNWFQKQTFKAFPRMIEQVKTGWRSKFRSYMQKVGNALASPAITNLTKPRNFVGKIKKQIKSVFNKLTQTKWIPNDEDYCTNGTCDLLMDFGKYLADDQAFRANLTPKQADSYVEFLKHIPTRQCKDNSTLVSCERCWWVGKCDGIKKKCNLRRWQRQHRIDPKLYIESSPKVKEIFKGLGWIEANEMVELKMNEPVGPPRRKKVGKHERLCHNDWLMRRGAKRAEHRRRSMASDWFFERKAQRSALRHNIHASDWVFDRYGQRAALRQN